MDDCWADSIALALYLGLGVDEQQPVSVDGDEENVWVGRFRGLLWRERHRQLS